MKLLSKNLKIETLVAALKQREREIFDYQINIDNFRLAIEKLNSKQNSVVTDMSEFKNQLEQLLSSNILEQAKSQLLYDVILQQLDGVDLTQYLEVENVD